MQWLKDDSGMVQSNRNQQYEDQDISQHFRRLPSGLYLHNPSPRAASQPDAAERAPGLSSGSTSIGFLTALWQMS